MKHVTAWLFLLASTMQSLAAPPSEIVGIWQCSNEIAAGWNEVYRFFPDGKVIWNANQMDLEKRLLERSGTWTLDGDRLTVKFTEEISLVGGKHVKPEDQAEGESVWIGAKEVRRKLAEPIVQETTFKKPIVRDNHPSTKLFNRRFWKMLEDPADYE